MQEETVTAEGDTAAPVPLLGTETETEPVAAPEGDTGAVVDIRGNGKTAVGVDWRTASAVAPVRVDRSDTGFCGRSVDIDVDVDVDVGVGVGASEVARVEGME